MDKKYCKDCQRWLGRSGAEELCIIPSCGLLPSERSPNMNRVLGFKEKNIKIDLEGQGFIKKRLKKQNYDQYMIANTYTPTNNSIYASVYKLNFDNSCYFYKPRLIIRLKNFTRKLLFKKRVEDV